MPRGVRAKLSESDEDPDFIPVLGYLDDLLILPFFIAITIKLIPKDVFNECRKGVYAIHPPSIVITWPVM